MTHSAFPHVTAGETLTLLFGDTELTATVTAVDRGIIHYQFTADSPLFAGELGALRVRGRALPAHSKSEFKRKSLQGVDVASPAGMSKAEAARWRK